MIKIIDLTEIPNITDLSLDDVYAFKLKDQAETDKFIRWYKSFSPHNDKLRVYAFSSNEPLSREYQAMLIKIGTLYFESREQLEKTVTESDKLIEESLKEKPDNSKPQKNEIDLYTDPDYEATDEEIAALLKLDGEI